MKKTKKKEDYKKQFSFFSSEMLYVIALLFGFSAIFFSLFSTTLVVITALVVATVPVANNPIISLTILFFIFFPKQTTEEINLNPNHSSEEQKSKTEQYLKEKMEAKNPDEVMELYKKYYVDKEPTVEPSSY